MMNIEQAFDNVSEENEKKHFIIKKSLRPAPSQGIVEQAKKRWRIKTPARDSKVTKDAPDERYN